MLRNTSVILNLLGADKWAQLGQRSYQNHLAKLMQNNMLALSELLKTIKSKDKATMTWTCCCCCAATVYLANACLAYLDHVWATRHESTTSTRMASARYKHTKRQTGASSIPHVGALGSGVGNDARTMTKKLAPIWTCFGVSSPTVSNDGNNDKHEALLQPRSAAAAAAYPTANDVVTSNVGSNARAPAILASPALASSLHSSLGGRHFAPKASSSAAASAWTRRAASRYATKSSNAAGCHQDAQVQRSLLRGGPWPD